MWGQCIYGQDFHEIHARLHGPKSLSTTLPNYKYNLANEIAEPRPDMNSKVAAITVSENSINTFTNCFDQDQGRKNVGPDLDPNCLTLWCIPERFFLQKDDFEKNQQTTKSVKNSTECIELSPLSKVNLRLNVGE